MPRCAHSAPCPHDSTQWVSIGSPPCATGAVLSLTPASQTHDGGQTATVTGNLSACGTPLQGATVNFAVTSGPNAGTTGSGISDASGNAAFSYTSPTTGTDTLSASVTNAAGTITSNEVTVIWIKRPTAITSMSALQPFAQGSTAILSSTLTDADSGAPLPSKPVTMTLGSGTGAQSCTATTQANGTATCSISPVTVALGPQPITDSFAGDTADLPSSNTQQALVFAYSTGGSFVVGDRSNTGSVTFWASQWATKNTLSRGPAPASFKGFEDSPATPTIGQAGWACGVRRVVSECGIALLVAVKTRACGGGLLCLRDDQGGSLFNRCWFADVSTVSSAVGMIGLG